MPFNWYLITVWNSITFSVTRLNYILGGPFCYAPSYSVKKVRVSKFTVMMLICEILPTHLHQQKQDWRQQKTAIFWTHPPSPLLTWPNTWMVLRSTTQCILAETRFYIPFKFILPGYVFMKYFKDHLQFLSSYDSETEIWSQKFVLNITLLPKKTSKKTSFQSCSLHPFFLCSKVPISQKQVPVFTTTTTIFLTRLSIAHIKIFESGGLCWLSICSKAKLF